MSKMLSKMNLISVVQQLPKEDIETIQGYVEMIEEENQELELELSGYRKAILNNKEMLGLKEQNQELKKQLEEYIKQNMKLKNELFDKRKEYQDTYKDVRIEIKEYKTQQKEFINYLENEIKLYENDIQNFKKDYKVYFSLINDLRVSKAKIEEILQKYKEIIGAEDDTN